MTKERSFIFKAGQKESPIRLKLETTRRKNAIDTFASREYLREEVMPTYKHSVGFQYAKIGEDESYSKMDVECGIPVGKDSVGFGKVDAFYTRRLYLVPDKLKLVWLIQGGLVRPMFGHNRVAINDRFFFGSPMGYTHMGHCYKSNAPQDKVEEVVGQEDQRSGDEDDGHTRGGNRRRKRGPQKEALGDDLGSLNYFQTQFRLEFMDIPLIKAVNLRTFTYLEVAFYPHLCAKATPSLQSLKDHSRLSLGYGFSIPVNDMISVLLYYNACNWGTHRGADHERRGYINVNFGFF